MNTIENMYAIFYVTMIIGVICPLFLTDWHARMVIIARAYPRRYGHGKSWKRAHKHYKGNWTLVERLLWIPLFKEWYERKYRTIAILSYVHFVVVIVTLCLSCVSFTLYPNSKLWVYVLVFYSLFWILRFIYDNAIGTEK